MWPAPGSDGVSVSVCRASSVANFLHINVVLDDLGIILVTPCDNVKMGTGI